MAQQLLNRPDIVAVLDQMRCKRVPECVTRRALRQPRRSHRLSHRPLNYRHVKMMPPDFARHHVDISSRCRKYILPSPLCRGVRVLSRQRIRNIDPSTAPLKISCMQSSNGFEMVSQPLLNSYRKHRQAILSPLPPRTTISCAPKSRSFTRRRRHSSTRSPDPYRSIATSLALPPFFQSPA